MSTIDKFEDALNDLLNVEDDEIDDDLRDRVRKASNRLTQFKKNLEFVLRVPLSNLASRQRGQD